MNTAFLVTKICNYKDLLAVYCNPSKTDKFLVGLPLKVTRNFLLLYLLSSDMQFDRICLCSIKTIYRIEKESTYLRKLPYCVPKNMTFINDPWNDLLSYAERKKLVVKVTLNTNSSPIYGISQQHTEKTFTFRIVNQEGETVKIVNVDCNDVETLVFEGINLQAN